jgi:hypothetical protein
LYAATAAGVALIAVAATAAILTSGGPLGPPDVQLSAAPLGVNITPWDPLYAQNTSAGGGVDVMQPLLKAAGIGQLRYGGGSYADFYDWQTNTAADKCLPTVTMASFKSGCASSMPLDFSQFSRQAKAIDANSFVTVNYGSGTPAEAAAWVRQAASTPGEGVALWEIGNESYGCWEVNDQLAGAPTHYRGYQASHYQTCPQITEGNAAGMRTLASSYAANSQSFLRAMKAADPSAQIGVPYEFGGQVQGATAGDSTEWNNTVLGADGKDIGFVDAHYYPFTFSGSTGGSNPTDQQVLQALRQIPSLDASIRAKLKTYAPSASLVIGEAGVSNKETMTTCTPVGALFAAGTTLSWLAAGAQSVDWWDINNYGNTGSSCDKPDYGLFTSSSPPATETPYDGYLLASILAKPHAALGTLRTSDPSNVLAFQSVLPDGTHAVALINIDTGSAQKVTFPDSEPLSGTLRTWSYSAGNQNSANSTIVKGTTSAGAIASGMTLPAESITILQTQ